MSSDTENGGLNRAQTLGGPAATGVSAEDGGIERGSDDDRARSQAGQEATR